MSSPRPHPETEVPEPNLVHVPQRIPETEDGGLTFCGLRLPPLPEGHRRYMPPPESVTCVGCAVALNLV